MSYLKQYAAAPVRKFADGGMAPGAPAGPTPPPAGPGGAAMGGMGGDPMMGGDPAAMGAGQDPAAAGAGDQGPDVVAQMESIVQEYMAAPSQQLESAFMQLGVQAFGGGGGQDGGGAMPPDQGGAMGGGMPPAGAAPGMAPPMAPPAGGGGEPIFKRGGKLAKPFGKKGKGDDESDEKLPKYTAPKRKMK